MHARFQNIQNTSVALRAGRCNIAVVYGGLFVRGRQLSVGCMAVDTGSRYDETAVNQTLAVDTHLIV